MSTHTPGELTFESTIGAGIRIGPHSDPALVRQLRDECTRWLDAYTDEVQAQNATQESMLAQLWPDPPRPIGYRSRGPR